MRIFKEKLLDVYKEKKKFKIFFTYKFTNACHIYLAAVVALLQDYWPLDLYMKGLDLLQGIRDLWDCKLDLLVNI